MSAADRLYDAEVLQLTKKSQVLLKFINSILTNFNMENINNLSDLKSISGGKLRYKSNNQIIDNHINEIKKEFAYDTKYEQRYGILNYLIVLLRGLLNELNLDFESSNLIKYDVNGNKIGTQLVYSVIIKINKINKIKIM